MKTRSITHTAAIFIVLTCSLPAQITVNGTGSLITNSNATNPGTSTITYSLANPSMTKVLVAGCYNDNGATATGATFGGNAATKFITTGRTSAATYILPSPAPATVAITVTFNGAGAPATGIFVYELGGVDTSGGAAAIDTGTGAAITTTGPDKFVVNFNGVNFSDGAGMIPAATSIIPSSNAGVFDINGGLGGGALLHGYGYSGTTGTKPLGWTGGNEGELSLAFVQAGDPDMDDDGLPDVWELSWPGITDLTQLNGLITNPVGAGNGSGDRDGDGISDFAEYNNGVNSSNPTVAASVPGDVDGDTLLDADEIAYFGNLSQGPGGDFDGDYASNKKEIDLGISPADASVWPDTDSDLMGDDWETANGLVVGTDDSAGHGDTDGFTNLEEFRAGTDPKDAAWTPENAILAHRWSFTGNLADSAGGSDAQIVNDNMANAGFSSDISGGAEIQLYGGGKATSDYVNLGSHLLSDLQSGGVRPVTIELWATQYSVQNWSRIFAFGKNGGANPILNESLRMTWTQGTTLNSDQVAWEGRATNGAPGNSPYVLGVPYHIVMTIVPAVFSNGAIGSGCQVTWYSSPASGSQPEGHPLYGSKGTFNSASDLRDLVDSASTLGRSFYPDNTASASYDEVRIWKGALTESERKLFQLLGPDNIDRSDVDNGGPGDGFPDEWELARFGNTTTATYGGDSDGDGISDDMEFADESNPNDILSIWSDVDKDGLEDAWERQWFNNLLQYAVDDPDGDLTDNGEEQAYGTNPTDPNSSPDTDGDGMSDGWELANFNDLTIADSTLRPGGADTNQDGDFDTDLEEFQGGFDPNDRFSGRDAENGGAGDGLPDYWEFFYFQPVVGANYLNIAVPSQDFDGDGATNLQELVDQTNPVDGNDFRDNNYDGYYDGRLLVTSDGFGVSSFNAGTNWPDAVAPAAGQNHMVADGLILRTPAVANQTTIFGGAKLAIVSSTIYLKGANSVAQANYILDAGVIRQAEDGNPITVAGTVEVFRPSSLLAENGPIVVSAKVSGSGDLTLTGSLAGIREVRLTNPNNTWTGDLTLNPDASLTVNGVLSPGTGSVYNIRPGGTGVTNSIGGSGAINLAGTMNIDLSRVTPTNGAIWYLVNSAVTYDAGFTVVDPGSLAGGFTPDAAAPGDRLWTSGNGDYTFDEVTGVLSFIGEAPGYLTWAGGFPLTAGVNDGSTDNPDNDSFANLLEYQLGGDPLEFDGNLVIPTQDSNYLIYTFQRLDASESDTTLNFRWGTDLSAWNTAPIGAADSGPDANGVIVTVMEDGGTSPDYDMIEVKLPKINAVGGKLFGRLEGVKP